MIVLPLILRRIIAARACEHKRPVRAFNSCLAKAGRGVLTEQ